MIVGGRLLRRCLRFEQVGLGGRGVRARILKVRLGLQQRAAEERVVDYGHNLVLLHVRVEVGEQL